MEEVIVKAVNQHYVVKCIISNFKDFLVILKTKLQVCSASKQGHFEAFFDIHNTLRDDELLLLFEACRSCNTIICGFEEVVKEPEMQVIHEPLFSGQKYFFDGPILILGNIPTDTYISSYDAIYVLGEAKGTIDLLSCKATLYASSFQYCFIRIYDAIFQSVTNFAPSYVYYNKQTLICSDLKEDVVWDKPLR